MDEPIMAQTFDKLPITVTEAAQNQIQLLANARDPKLRLRIFTKPGGCSGLEYDMKLDYKTETDLFIDFGESGGVVSDPSFIDHIQGITLDYKDELLTSGFKISNPNATKTCGCGTSFRTAEDKGNVEKC